MIKFNQFIAEEKNTHMTHIEDLVIDRGVNGSRDAIMALRSLRDMLKGNSDSAKVTVKWDGAPAVFVGIDPSDGKFFVAKKGIFNKNPKVYKSHNDIDEDISNGDLNAKMKTSFDYLQKLGIKKGVYQGDIMFTSDDVQTETIKGEEYVTFHPNTILYAVPASSEEAQVIKKAKIGVVFHTAYEGDTFEGMRASYGVDVSRFRKTSDVWAQSADLPSAIGKLMSKSETIEVNKALSTAGKIFNKTSGNILRDLSGNKEMRELVNIYNNQSVRKGEAITNTLAHARGLLNFIKGRYDSEISKKKTERSKITWLSKKQALVDLFNKYTDKQWQMVFELQNAIVTAKLIIINKLDNLNNVNTFVKTTNGFKATGSEGFVAVDKLGGGAVKLVNRLEFSTNNFSNDVIKGWDSPRRG